MALSLFVPSLTKESLHPRLTDYPLLGREEDLFDLAKSCRNFLITIGQIKSPEPRTRLFEHLKQLGMTLPIVVSPLAHVSRQATLGEGTIVMHHALVNAGAFVGRNGFINMKALIEDHGHISTTVVVNGVVKIQCCSFIGNNEVLGDTLWLVKSRLWGQG